MLKSLKSLLLAGSALLALSACGPTHAPNTGRALPSSTAGQLNILAGSEMKDLETVLPALQQQTGVAVKLTYSGTLDAVERVANGERFDAVWVSHGKYLQLTPAAASRIKASEKTMLSPVVFGIKTSKAQALGWAGAKAKPVTWKDIATAAEAGKFTFAMTNPTASNSGFTAMVGLAAALSNNPDALTVDAAKNPKLAKFFAAQKLTAGSSGWLTDAYVREQDHLDAMVNYESVLLALNQSGQLKEALTLVYPNEGIVTADYPLMLLNGERRAEYDKLVAALRSAPVQSAIMEKTLRRPVNSEVALLPAFGKQTLIELSFPGSLAIVDGLLETFLADIRVPAHSWFVLDTSGSMRGDRIAGLRQAVLGLAGGDTSLSGRFARFQKREAVSLTAFSNVTYATQHFDLGQTSASVQAGLQGVQQYAQGLQADGGTALFASIQRTLLEAAQSKASEKSPHYHTLLVMTDGLNNQDPDFENFRRWYAQQSPTVRSIKIFPVIFGEASPAELQALAQMSGGKAFNGQQAGLSAVFKEIRGYQ